jgi:hypothetical protein
MKVTENETTEGENKYESKRRKELKTLIFLLYVICITASFRKASLR